MKFKSFIKKNIISFDYILRNNLFKHNNLISIFYYVRGHFNFNYKFINSYENKSTSPIFINIFFFILRRLRSFFFIYKKFENKTKLQKYDYLIVSHKIDTYSYDDNNDFYYGNLISNLINKQNKKVCLLLFNQTLINSSKLYKTTLKNSKLDLMLLNNRVNLLLELGLIKKLFVSFLSFLFSISKNNYYNKKIIFSSFFDEETFNNFRIYSQFKDIFKKKFNNIIITYEGHSYERSIIRSIRELSPKTKIIAYVHSALYHTQHSIYNSYGYKNDPDLILFGSRLNFKTFLTKANYNRNLVSYKILGSKKITPYRFKKSKTITNFLILPDGTDHDIIKLFKLSIQLSSYYHNYFFTINLHPNAYLKFQSLKLKKIPDNLTITIGQIKKAFVNNNFVIFTSTTAIIEGINCGLYPIFYKNFSTYEFDNNPLSEVWDDNLSFDNFQNLSKVIENYSLSDEILTFASDYYQSFDYLCLVSNNHE